MVRYKKILSIFALLLISLTAFAAGKPTLTIEKPRGKSTIEVGDVFHIRISVPGRSMEMTWSGGVPGARVLHPGEIMFDKPNVAECVITLRAMEPGNYKFGPINVNDTKTNAVSYTIKAKSKETTTSGKQPDKNAKGVQFIGKGDDKIFLKATVSKNTAFEQEALTYVVKLYTTYRDLRFLGAVATPSFDGFTVDVSDDISTQYMFEEYEGKTYKTAVVAKYIIFPQITGKLKITGNTYTVSATATEIYSDAIYDKIEAYRNVQLNVTPNDLEIDVKPLPSPRPTNFSGGVGHYSISSTLPSQKFATNRAASIEYTVKGTGNLKYVKMPDLNSLYPSELEVLEPTSDVQCKIQGGTLSGYVKFDYSFTPLETGEYNIPEIEFVYFNPESGQYETAKAKGYKIDVAKGKDSDKSQTKIRLRFDDTIVPIGSLSKEHTPIVCQLWYWIIYIAVILIIAIILFVYRRRIKALSNMDLLRSKKAGSVARKRLKKAAVFMKRGQREQFYTEMLHATWGFLCDRLHIPQSELNRDNVMQALLDAGCAEEQSNQLISLLDDCEFAKYASAAATGDMRSVYNRGVSLINYFANTINAKKS